MTSKLECISLDVHAHLAPIFPDELARIRGVSWNAPKKVLTVDGHDVGMKPLFDPLALVAWMEEHNVETAWISIPPPLYRPELQNEDAKDWVFYVNSGLARIAESHPKHFSPLPHLPLQVPELALEVAQDWISKGHQRFGAPSGGSDLVLSDPAYTPLWQALDAANAFVFFHPGECADGRLKAFYLSNLVGNPYESAVAISHLVFGGVIERHPSIRFCFAHGGGALPVLAGRLERGFDTKRPGITTGGKSPKELLKHICVDCIMHDEAALELAEHAFGQQNVVFGSDWPFPMGVVAPHTQMASINPQRRARIFCDNPARLNKETSK
jgi:aminocarboxymuconate-semialdehyde decarboxylase